MENIEEYAQTCNVNYQKISENIHKLFTDYPKAQKKSYCQHCLDNINISARVLVAGGALLIHALFPCVLQKWGERQIHDIDSFFFTQLNPIPVGEDHPLSNSVHE